MYIRKGYNIFQSEKRERFFYNLCWLYELI